MAALPEPPNARDESRGNPGEVSLLRLLAILLDRWRIVAAAVFAATFIAGLAAVLLPRTYTARVTLVPPTDGTTLPFLGAAAMALPVAGLTSRLTGQANNQQLVEAILRSESLRDSVVARLDGAAAIDDPRSSTRRTLKKRTSIRRSDSDASIAVRVTHRDPARAQHIAALFPEIINDLATQVSVQTALQKRSVLERQISIARQQLEESENRLLAFEQEREVPAVQEQARQAMIAAADLQRAVVEQELAVARLRRTVTADHPQLQAAQGELQARREQLQRLRSSAGTGLGVLTTGELPQVKLTAARLLREFMKDEQVYLSLTASLAEAEVDATQNLAVVTMLDAPRLPVRSSGPRRLLYLVGGALIGLFLGIAGAFISAYYGRARATSDGQYFANAWDRFRGDVFHVFLKPRRAPAGQSSVRP